MIAFAYADLLQALKPIYRGLADGLVANIREVMPNEPILHITDDETQAIAGCNVLRVRRKVLPMSWRLLAHACAHEVHDEILFTEPDVRFMCNVMDAFNDQFDVTVTDRERPKKMKDKPMVPITLGVNFSRSAAFWTACAKRCLTLGRKPQLWGGDMEAVYHVMQSGKYRVKTLPAAEFNHVPLSQDGWPGAKALHYKGTRKTWLFPHMSEAA